MNAELEAPWETTEEINAWTLDYIEWCNRSLSPEEWWAVYPSLVRLAVIAQRPHARTPSDLHGSSPERTS